MCIGSSSIIKTCGDQTQKTIFFFLLNNKFYWYILFLRHLDFPVSFSFSESYSIEQRLFLKKKEKENQRITQYLKNWTIYKLFHTQRSYHPPPVKEEEVSSHLSSFGPHLFFIISFLSVFHFSFFIILCLFFHFHYCCHWIQYFLGPANSTLHHFI